MTNYTNQEEVVIENTMNSKYNNNEKKNRKDRFDFYFAFLPANHRGNNSIK